MGRYSTNRRCTLGSALPVLALVMAGCQSTSGLLTFSPGLGNMPMSERGQRLLATDPAQETARAQTPATASVTPPKVILPNGSVEPAGSVPVGSTVRQVSAGASDTGAVVPAGLVATSASPPPAPSFPPPMPNAHSVGKPYEVGAAPVTLPAGPGEVPLPLIPSEEQVWAADVECDPVASLHGAALLEPYGADPDGPGLFDNVSVSLGAAYHDYPLDTNWDALGMIETSHQIGRLPLFVHGGVATEWLDRAIPISYSVGVSKLATIVGGEVENPFIVSVAYDGHRGNTEIFDSTDYHIDQFRLLAGLAVHPRFDFGAWTSFTWHGEYLTDFRGEPVRVENEYNQRIAGYASANIGEIGTQVVFSAGWEEDPGRFFCDLTSYVPLTDNANLFASAWYSDIGAWTVYTGVEFTLGHRYATVTGPALSPHKVRASLGQCDPTGACASATRYRGGWANRNYRGALRVQPPSRMQITDPQQQARRAVSVSTGEPVTIDLNDGPVVDPQSPLDTPTPREDLPKRDSLLKAMLGL